MFQFPSNKGQYILIEHMLYFALGVIIFSSSFYTFTKVRDRISIYSTREVFKNIANYVTNQIVRIYTIGKEMNTSKPVEITLSLPQKVNGQYYRLIIQGNQTKIFSLRDPKISYTMSLYNLERSVEINGTIDSRVSDRFTLKYMKFENKIILR